jgi:hypothetical protein
MLKSLGAEFGNGGTGVTDGTLREAVKELQGLTVTVVAGAAAGTKMSAAAMRTEDTLLAALVSVNAGGAMVDDSANMTIQETHAFGTITISGNPVDAETFVVNGVTFRFKTVPLVVTDAKITAGDVTAMAAAVAAVINAHENRMLPDGGGYNTPQVVATSSAGVVTIKAVVDGVAGNAITLTESATNTAVTGAGTLTSGTDTGGVKSTTDLSAKTVTLMWYNKK